MNTGTRTCEVFIGTVGDLRLILKLGGDWRSKYSPVLEIRLAPSDFLFDRIVYKNRIDGGVIEYIRASA